MERKIVGKRPTFKQTRKGSSFYRIMDSARLILAALWMLMRVERGQVKSPFEPTPTPTPNGRFIFYGS